MGYQQSENAPINKIALTHSLAAEKIVLAVDTGSVKWTLRWFKQSTKKLLKNFIPIFSAAKTRMGIDKNESNKSQIFLLNKPNDLD